MSSLTRQQVIDWLKTTHIKAENVLDIGAGDNPANNYAKVECKRYARLDIDKYSKPDYLVDLSELWCCLFLKAMREKWDVIFCIEVMEHIKNPAIAFHNMRNVLKPNGKLFLSVVLIYPHHGKNDYLRFTDYGLRAMLEEADFTDIKIIPRIATAGKKALMEFFEKEGMHSSELRKEYQLEVPIGYMVEARKKSHEEMQKV